MRLFYNQRDGIFFCQSLYEEKAMPKSAGFLWNPIKKRWETKDVKKAMKLINYADGIALEKIKEKIREIRTSIAMSKQISADIDIPKPDCLEYLPFQKAGIAYALERDVTLFADEMGLGKTIQAIGYINAKNDIKRVLVICPATLKLNWKREMEKWLVRKFDIDFATTKDFPDVDIVIINYDIVTKLRKQIDAVEWDLLICDECHALKNPKAMRTIAILGKKDGKEKVANGIKAKYKLFLTGTPVLNKPIELYPLLSSLNIFFAKSFWDFAAKYCGAYNNGWGWRFDGASNLEELQTNLRSTIMIRRLKEDVLKELPSKRRQIIEIAAEGKYLEQVEKEKELQEKYNLKIEELENLLKNTSEEEYKKAVEELRYTKKIAFDEMAKIRHETALIKLPAVIEHCKNLLETQMKIVVYAHHIDVIRELKRGLIEFNPVTLTGENSIEERQKVVDLFQNDENVRVFIGSITAAGIGITLTAASVAVFAELDWVPSNITQAEDRLHRIGQKDSVLIQHLVIDNSIDAKMAKTIVEKQEIILKILDKDVII